MNTHPPLLSDRGEDIKDFCGFGSVLCPWQKLAEKLGGVVVFFYIIIIILDVRPEDLQLTFPEKHLLQQTMSSHLEWLSA